MVGFFLHHPTYNHRAGSQLKILGLFCPGINVLESVSYLCSSIYACACMIIFIKLAVSVGGLWWPHPVTLTTPLQNTQTILNSWTFQTQGHGAFVVVH